MRGAIRGSLEDDKKAGTRFCGTPPEESLRDQGCGCKPSERCGVVHEAVRIPKIGGTATHKSGRVGTAGCEGSQDAWRSEQDMGDG